MLRSTRFIALVVLFLIPVSVFAQLQRDVVALKSWPAPLYWQPTRNERVGIAQSDTSLNVTADATTPANALVFVGMTPCRVVDTRNPNGPLGGPALTGGASRTFPI